MAYTRQRSKGRREKGGFIAIPHLLHDYPAFSALSGSALKVLLGIARQYRGYNNGDLSATHTQALRWGIGSRTTLSKALEDLQEAGLIIRTRTGTFTNPGGRCALYALAWHPINECPGKDLDTPPTQTPPLKLSLQNKTPGTVSVPG